MNSNAILPILLELLAKSAVILVAAAAVHCALRRVSAARRYYVWIGAFAALLFLPVTKLASPLWPLSWQKPLPAQTVPPVIIPDVEPISVVYSEPASIGPATVTVKRTDWPGVAIAAWLAGGLLILGYQLVGRIRLAIIERRSTEPNDPHLNALMQAAVEEAAIKKPVVVRVSEDLRIPVTWGVWRPILLLPQDWREWSEVRLIAVLRHELAHIARRDYPARRLSQFAISLYWPNPMVWLAGAALRRTQEQACDDRVLGYGTPAADYATLLFESVRALSGQRIVAREALAMARPSSLESRLVAIVDDTRDRRRGGMAALLGFVAFVAVTLTFSAIAQVESDRPTAKEPLGTERPANGKSAESGSDFAPTPLPGSATAAQGNGNPTKELKRKLDSIIIPLIAFREATLSECFDFLRRKSVQFDPENKGVNFVLMFSPEDPVFKSPVTLNLEDVSLTEAIKYVTNLTNTRWRIANNAVVVAARSEVNSDVLFQREYQLPPGTPLAFQNGEATRADSRSPLSREGFLRSGPPLFPEGASAVYIPSRGRLIVRNTEENLDLIEQIVADLIKAPPVVVQAPGNSKLEEIIIPRLEFRAARLDEAIQFLSKRIRDLDPEKKGVNLELAWRPEVEQPPITISLSNIPALEALKFVTNLGGAKYRFESKDRIVIEPIGTVSLITKQYRVPANSISTKEGIVKGPDGVTYASPHEFFSAFGISFPPGASAGLPVSGDAIVMRNTEENLELGEEIILALVEAKGGKLPDEKLTELRRTLESLKAFRR